MLFRSISKTAFQEVYNSIETITDKQPRTIHEPIVLGNIVLQEGTYNLDGTELNPPIKSEMFCVDIFKEDNEDFSKLEPFEVTPSNPLCKIAGK